MPHTSQSPSQHQPPTQRNAASARLHWLAEPATALYIALITLLARCTGFSYLLFPELGALSHDILKRPHGTWARAPLMLVITPFFTAVVGTLVTQHLPYGLVSVLLTVGSAIVIIRLLRSPIAPAISAGLLPLTLGVPSWWYPPSLLVGTAILAGIAVAWGRIVPVLPTSVSISDIIDDITEEAPNDYSWVPFFLAFVVVTTFTALFTGWRFLLFPPLVVIGFEMFAHASICPWAGRPLILPVACALCATAGVAIVGLLGTGPLAAACSIAFSIAVLRVCDLHVPPSLAVGLLPFVIPQPSYELPISVGIGTLLLTTSFLAWRKVTWTRKMSI